MPLVSVVIPTYNRASLVKEAILSVINQNFKDWELLVVDDRSTDNTEDIVKSLAEKDSRIKYLKNEFAKGPSGARNYGIKHSKGDLIAFLDSDDLWKPWHLERGIYFLEKYNDIDWFYADIEMME
ncbi:MAG: glycosyltransferase family 2 protein, partial [Desulfonauticus sp.]|nr:glycosyltransferase family 2 protein [Desulfonauticus sp.]